MAYSEGFLFPYITTLETDWLGIEAVKIAESADDNNAEQCKWIDQSTLKNEIRERFERNMQTLGYR